MASSTTAARRRHAGAGAGEWAAVSAAGGARRVEAAGKHQLMRRTGLPARDLRALDPALSYPSSISGRDRAVVVNLDSVRAVITAAEVLVPAPRDPAVAPLVAELRARLAAPPPPPSPGVGGAGGKDAGQAPSGCGGKGALPFEFRALEVCLEFACKALEQETCTLEKEAYPALDELSSNVSTLNLERVRQIKMRLVAISGRVQKVRDELEHLLDDDADMAAMHLSEKLAYQNTADGRSSRLDVDNEQGEFDEERDGEVEEEGGTSEGGGYGNGTSAAAGFTPKIDELEILLESYFVQTDGTLNKLNTLREYVDDTEDYINIMLDEKQNQLLQMGIMLSTGTLVVSAGIAVTGVFGMNITIPLYTAATDGAFWQVTGGIVGATAAVYLVALLCYRRSGILQ
ncbi:unnamed protein product [Urochloa decumbens]|uniref:Magnesium transporter n=1 Tax=Urochloa decumbens TaxID=240449 RepID=A0ABC9F0X2_9POAL